MTNILQTLQNRPTLYTATCER